MKIVPKLDETRWRTLRHTVSPVNVSGCVLSWMLTQISSKHLKTIVNKVFEDFGFDVVIKHGGLDRSRFRGSGKYEISYFGKISTELLDDLEIFTHCDENT